MDEATIGQVDQMFARGPIEYPGPTHPTEDWVAITEYELREVAEHMPGGRAVPVQVRGFDADQVLVLQANGSGGLPALVALARLRTAVTGPTVQEPQSDAQGPDYAQECATEDTPDRALSRLADDMQAEVECALTEMKVDPAKFDHQNRAGDLVHLLLAVLRRHALLVLTPEADKILNGPSGGRSLRQAVRDGYLSQRDEVQDAIWRGLTGPGSARQPIERVMDELDKVLAR